MQIQSENQTLASITFQNYFRMYGKLAGMTGTADTEAYEFQQIYRLETVVIPTHRPMIRKDAHDQVFRTLQEKYDAIIDDIKDCHERGQPVLVGTTSIENSELLSDLLKKEKLAAPSAEREAARARSGDRRAGGPPGSVTIATNMAGRGTDIVLGGNVEKQVQFVEADERSTMPTKHSADRASCATNGSRCTIRSSAPAACTSSAPNVTSRAASTTSCAAAPAARAIPGSSRFYLSLEDPLLRIFAGERLSAIMERLKMPEGEPIEHPSSRARSKGAAQVEARNFDIRKQLLEYDDVANDQRRVIYQQRNELLETDDIAEMIDESASRLLHRHVRAHVPPDRSRSNGTSRARSGAGRRLAAQRAARRSAGGRTTR